MKLNVSINLNFDCSLRTIQFLFKTPSNRFQTTCSIKVQNRENGGSCECGNEPPGSMKCREFLNPSVKK